MSNTRVPMIIDTDPGVDDAVALLLAAASPEVRLLAVTTVFGNVGLELTTSNALRLRTLADIGHVPVAMGAGRPLVYPQQERADSFHATDGLGGRAATLPEPSGPVNARGAITLMADLVAAVPDPVTLVAIGPLTNIALLLAAHPEVKPHIGRIVVMGGTLSAGNTTTGAVAEFNVGCDPEAARRVLVEEDVPVTLVPLDLTLRAGVDGAWLAALAEAGPRCATLAAIVHDYRRRFSTAARTGPGGAAGPAPSEPEPAPGDAAAEGTVLQDDALPTDDTPSGAVASGAVASGVTVPRDATVPLHDSLAVLEASVPGTLRTRPMTLEVVCDHGPARGAVVPVDAGSRHANSTGTMGSVGSAHLAGSAGRPVDVAVDADLPALSATILDRLRGLR